MNVVGGDGGGDVAAALVEHGSNSILEQWRWLWWLRMKTENCSGTLAALDPCSRLSETPVFFFYPNEWSGQWCALEFGGRAGRSSPRDALSLLPARFA